MTFQCEHCGRAYRDNYNLNRHLNKKYQCTAKKQRSPPAPNKHLDSSGVTIINNYITINQQINHFGIILNEHIGIPGLTTVINKYDENHPMFTTGKALLEYKDLLNYKPENKNAIVDPKSKIGKIFINGIWQPKPKTEIIDTSIKQTARDMSDRMDIVGVDAPTGMVAVLEIISSEGITPDPSVLILEGIEDMTNAERRSLYNGMTVRCMK